MEKRPKYIFLKYFALGTYLAFIIASTLLVGMYIGYHLDKKVGTGTVMTFVFSVLGLTAGLRSCYKTILDIGKNEGRNAAGGDDK